MIKIFRKVDKPNNYNGFRSDTSSFIQGRTSSGYLQSEKILP